jgi:hypothetical protein
VVGRLVEQQQVGVARERASERRAGQLAAGERVERAVEVLVAEAEAVQRGVDALAPRVPARVLQARLRARVGLQRRGLGGPTGHGRLQLRQPRLQVEQVAAAREHVVAQRQVALARRALVVQGDADVLGERQLAAVHGALAGEHAQQRGLARAVAPGQGQPVPALQPERDAAQERLPRDVLREVGGDDHGHETSLGILRPAMRIALLTVATLLLSAPMALAQGDGGEGLWGETNDKVVTNAGFILIAAFPLLVFALSMTQRSLDKRKDRRKAAEKARKARADMRGGW